MEPGLLVINAGSSSIKFAGYTDRGENEPSFLGRGQVEDLRGEPRFVCKNAIGEVLGERQWPGAIAHGEAIDHIIGWIEAHATNVRVAAAGHRVVFGGAANTGPNESLPGSKSWSRSSLCTFLIIWRQSRRWPSSIRHCRRPPVSTTASTARSRG